MEVTEKDFSKEFLERFEDKEKQYILDFCNTFLRTFPNILDKSIIIDRISTISSIQAKLQKEGVTGETIYNNMSISYRPNQSERDERNTIYHELFHVLSHRKNDKNLYLWGLYEEGIIFFDDMSDDFYTEHSEFDEIMNEYYTIKMLEQEDRFFEGKYEEKAPTKIDPTRIITRFHGNGYRTDVHLAEIYDMAFGTELLKAKLLDREKFVEKFNKQFKNLDIKTSTDYTYMTQFSKIGHQLVKDKDEANITAIEVWKECYKDRHVDKKIDLFDYLQESKRVEQALPQFDSYHSNYTGNINTAIPFQLLETIRKADEEIIMQQLRPDLVGEQTETEKIIQKKRFLEVISTLRDNIEELTRENVEKVSYGEMSQYNHSNLSCLIVSAGKKNFMTFASEDGYRGSSEFSNLPKDQIREIFGDDREVEYATVPTPRYKWSIIRDNNGYIPLTDNPNMEHVELTDEVYLDGSSVEKTADSKDGQGMGLKQEHGTIVDNNDNRTESRKSSSFEESLKADSTQNKKRKMNSASFRASLATKRKEHRTGHQDVNKSRNIIALRRERDRLLRGENLSEEQMNRLNEINAILLGEQQSQKKYNGIGR